MRKRNKKQNHHEQRPTQGNGNSTATIEKPKTNEDKKKTAEERLKNLAERVKISAIYEEAEDKVNLKRDLRNARLQGLLEIDEDPQLTELEKQAKKQKLLKELDDLEAKRVIAARKNKRKIAKAKKLSWFEIIGDKFEFFKDQIRKNFMFTIVLVVALSISIALHQGVFTHLANKMNLGNGFWIGLGLATLMESTAILMYLNFMKKTSFVIHLMTLAVIAISGIEQYLNSDNGNYNAVMRALIGLIPYVGAIAVSIKLQIDYLEKYKVKWHVLPGKRKKQLIKVFSDAKKQLPKLQEQHDRYQIEIAKLKPVNKEIRNRHRLLLLDAFRKAGLPEKFLSGDIKLNQLSEKEIETVKIIKKEIPLETRKPEEAIQPRKILNFRELSNFYKLDEQSLKQQASKFGILNNLIFAELPKKTK
ncbi:MAG: hypothetical protein KDK45_20165, partial [Leptospiraceae bacterium]|nr:hypothetical protein [Leptospiraceae bacterium]